MEGGSKSKREPQPPIPTLPTPICVGDLLYLLQFIAKFLNNTGISEI